jgi:hypothetical protein
MAKRSAMKMHVPSVEMRARARRFMKEQPDPGEFAYARELAAVASEARMVERQRTVDWLIESDGAVAIFAGVELRERASGVLQAVAFHLNQHGRAPLAKKPGVRR